MSSVTSQKNMPPSSTTTTTKTVQIPLTGTTWAMLQVPFPMTEDNWKEMEDFLKLMKRPLTEPPRPTHGGW